MLMLTEYHFLNLQVTMIGTSEAMNLGISLGLDPKLLAGIMSSATGRCWPVRDEALFLRKLYLRNYINFSD